MGLLFLSSSSSPLQSIAVSHKINVIMPVFPISMLLLLLTNWISTAI